MAYNKTRNGGTAEKGIREHQIWNGKIQIRNTKSGPNCIECLSHANKSRLVDSSVYLITHISQNKPWITKGIQNLYVLRIGSTKKCAV